MKRMKNLGKAMALMAVMIMMAGSVLADTYTLDAALAANAHTPANWKNSLGGGASSFGTGGDIFIIPQNVTASFGNNQHTIISFGTNVTLRVIGTVKIDAGNNFTTSLNILGYIIFESTTNTQVTFQVGSTNSFAKFILDANATLTTANSNGIVGLNCSIPTSTATGAVTLPITASYVFNGVTQRTTGLPATVANLTLSGNGIKTLTAATTVSNALTINSGSTFNINGFIASAGTLTGSGILTNSSATARTFTTGSTDANTTFTGTISGALSLTKTGAGVLTLSGTNTYTGATTISAGTLSIANVNNLGSATSAIVLGSASAKGTLTYTGTTPADFTRGFTVNAVGGELSGSLSSLSGAIALNGPLTLLNTGNTTLSGVLSSSGALAINNEGNTIILSGINTYTGATSITAGTLQLGNAAALGTSSGVAVANGATLELNGFSTARPLALSGTLSNSPLTAVNYDGAIILGAASILAATGDITLGGGINGNFSLTKTEAGTLNTGTVLSEIGDLTISAGKLIIPTGGKVSVAGETVVTPAEGLTILSDGNGTGSLITATASGDGTAKVERYMDATKWHIVSSPVTGLTVNKFLTENASIPYNKATGYTTQKGMSEYDPANNEWKDYFDTKTENGSIITGKGYSVRVKTGETKVSFIGTLNASVPALTNLVADKWNCIGNPYTSAIQINAAVGIANFLDLNSGSLDPLFGAIYLWHQANPEVNNVTVGKYESISNATTSDVIPAGQAFMVRMKEEAQSISFPNTIQVHNTTMALKSTRNVWPTIKLTATVDNITSSTIVAFHEGMTAGLDPTYDAGLLKGGAPLEVYTRLVEDNGIPFDIQALPTSYESIVVPVGIDCTQGSQVNFSAELLHVPSACQVILEDRLNQVFTDLSLTSYTADLMGSTVSEDRFFLHTSNTTTGLEAKGKLQDLRAWAVSNQEIKISGAVTSKAMATLYDLQGRAVSICPLQETNLNSMPLKGLKQGVYLLRVQDSSRVQVLKVAIGE